MERSDRWIETFFDIILETGAAISSDPVRFKGPEDSRELKELCVAWADEFEKNFGTTDWNDQSEENYVDYFDAVDAFSAAKWKEYDDCH